MATPVTGGGHPARLPDDGDKKGSRKRKGEGAGPAETSGHDDKRFHKAPTLSKAHQAYVISFITDLHRTATESYTATRAINLTAFFVSKKDEMFAKRGELSSIAIFRFVHTKPELKQKAVQGFEALDWASWKAFEVATAAAYDPSAEARIREEVEAFCAHDKIARENAWNKDTIMEHVTGKNPKALVKHIFPEANIS